MLGNLIKYEIRATRRIFLPLYGLILVFALVNKIFISANYDEFGGSVPFTVAMTIYVLLIAALFVMTLVVLIQRFQKNLLGDEGYLSFTLPVKTHMHLDAKTIVTVMWTVLSLIVAALSIFLLAVDANTLQQMREGWPSFLRAYEPFGASFYGVLAEVIILALFSIAEVTLHIYLSIAVGNFSSRHKLLAAFGVFLGVSVVEQVVTSLLMNAGVRASIFSDFFVGFGSMRYGWDASAPVLAGFLGVQIAYTLVFGALFYFFTDWILSRKLNLE